MSYSLDAVGYVRGPLTMSHDDFSGATAAIELTDIFGSDALAGLAAFSHAEIIFLFDSVKAIEVETGAQRPEDRSEWPLVGIFAQRAKNRPNRLGSMIAEIASVSGITLELRGLNIADGTPIIDIRPVFRGFMPRSSFKQPRWADEFVALRGSITEEATM